MKTQFIPQKTRSILTRIITAVLLLSMIGCLLTSCGGGAASITTLTKIGAVKVTEANAMSDKDLEAIANEIAENKEKGFTVRQQLVAALNGYDMSASDFDDKKVASGELQAKPEEAAQYAYNVLGKNGIGRTGCATITTDGENLIMNRADVQSLVDCFKTKVETEAKLGWFAQLLQWVGLGFSWLINVPGFGSFILGTLYFAILLELLMLPLGINQQKNSRKQAKLRPKEMAIRNKYKGRNDQETQRKVNEEIQKLYTSEGYSPMSGCLPMLLTLPFLFALYYVVIDPMTYIFGAPQALTSAVMTYAGTPVAAGGLGLSFSPDRGTIEMLSLIRENSLSLDSLANFQYFANSPECLNALSGLSDSIPNFNLFGLNMGLKPGFVDGDPKLLFMPVLTFIVYWGSGKLTRKFSFQPLQQEENKNDPATGCSNTMMNVMMPAMSAYFTFVVPAAVGLYWLFKSVISTLKQFILYKAMPMPTFTEEEYKAAERELMGKEPKNKPAPKSSGTRNPNVRSLHHIDDEDYESPAEREARLAARKADYVEPEDETPAPKTADGAFGEGVTLKDDDRPARKDKKNKKNEND